MTEALARALGAALGDGEPAVLVTVAEARGSTPREAGAAMLVTPGGQAGTIGGGALEWAALLHARDMLAAASPPGASCDVWVPLGPEIGQCCGGRVRLRYRRADAALLDEVGRREAAARAVEPTVLVFGAGHVGRALALALAPLPVRAVVVDTRPDALAGLPAGVAARCTPLPEAEVEGAPAGAAFVVMTHSHALDFMVAEAALLRRDAAYVGMIGSRTKRARFVRYLLGEGRAPDLAAELVLPIGGAALRDKRPPVIAALVAAEVAARVLLRAGSAAPEAEAGAPRAA